MNEHDLHRWQRELVASERRATYQVLADLIATDIDSGRLRVRDKLPPLRDLAEALDINYTTAARAYTEARQRGLIESRPGAGSFIKGRAPVPGPVNGSYEMTMNLIIEPAAPELIEQIHQGTLRALGQHNLHQLLRYQSFGGAERDRDLATAWLRRRVNSIRGDQVLVCPGIHSALLGLMNLLVTPGKFLCVESLAYPGIKAMAAQLGLALCPLDRDDRGPLPRSFEHACKKGGVAALYINPTIHNPTTTTIPTSRRERLADIALRYSIPIIEDEAYTMLSSTPVTAFADLAPELTYYVTGMSKCFGPGLRSAFLHSPSKRQSQRVAAAMRALTVMSSPITDTLVSTFIEDGTADAMLAAVIAESNERLMIARQYLDPTSTFTAEGAFHLWLELPRGPELNASELAVELRDFGVSAVSSATFSTNNAPPDALRICYGGPISRKTWEENLQHIVEALDKPSLLSSLS